MDTGWRAKETEDPFPSPCRTSAAEAGANLTLQADLCLKLSGSWQVKLQQALQWFAEVNVYFTSKMQMSGVVPQSVHFCWYHLFVAIRFWIVFASQI